MRRILFTVLPLVAAIALTMLILPADLEDNKGEIVVQNGNYAKYLKDKSQRKKGDYARYDSPDMHAQIQREMRTPAGADGPGYAPNQILNEYKKAKAKLASARGSASTFDFVDRGPGNVGGRTRALIVDPDDATGNTWFAGSATGGIWKTTDGGDSWDFISDDLPHMATNTLAMSPANTNVIYAGTGEHFQFLADGVGLFKSTDKGVTWTQIADPETYSDFQVISRIIVDPSDEDVVLVTSRNTVWHPNGDLEGAIYKSTDGGANWTRVRSSTTERYDHIIYDPNDFNTQYVSILGTGVIKSTDGGDTWTDASTGLFPDGRVELAISPVNSNRLWASTQGQATGTGADLYLSSDAGATWNLALDGAGNNVDFLVQGGYDNYAIAHPFDEDVVYVGGVNNWKFTYEGGTIETGVVEVDAGDTEAFMGRVNFGAGVYDGARLAIGDGLTVDDLIPVEIRFGQGTQLAHRFTVDKQGAGVPANEYAYQDYVEVPFQAWNTESNTQLMVSFRDQQEDGAWNLIEQNTTDGDEENHSREYVFVHFTTYSETASSAIAQNGGHEEDDVYFIWPYLQDGATFDPAALPVSTYAVDIVDVTGAEITTFNVSDAYGDYEGLNDFSNQGTRSEGIHPDQHNNILAEVDAGSSTFKMIVTNDGGIYESANGTDPGTSEGAFTYRADGYNTTQYYGADKAPGEDRYIGGTQDNGTWYNAAGVTGSATADATFGIGGDGFEALWHSGDIKKMIGGSQGNNFRRTVDGGLTWTASLGYGDTGPFVTRLAHHKSTPDNIYTVGAAQGIWYSRDFGANWEVGTLNDSELWGFSNFTDIEVSYANPNVVWAGAYLDENRRVFVSTDAGETVNAVANYDLFEMGFISSIASHPTDDQTAYLTFAYSDYPKILKTEDLGQTWEDISGYDGSGDRGFPDVPVFCLFVFPTDTDRIWAGTQIGIVESLDGGASWNLLSSNFPQVYTYAFKLTDNQLVIATYGRGIWSVEIPDLTVNPVLRTAFKLPTGEIGLEMTLLNEYDSTEIYIDGALITTIYDNAIGALSEQILDNSISGDVSIQLIGYIDGTAIQGVESEAFILPTNDLADSYSTDFEDAEDDFFGEDLVIQDFTFFNNKALHTPHPYEDASSYVHYLKTPITVASSNANFDYSDVAIVETGTPGTVFGDAEFWDYVIVEATNDGLNWTPLEPGYDADYDPAWKAAYDGGGAGRSSLFRSHTIDLLELFDAGDNILVRFRMFADANTNGYGWVIDDIYIQEEPPLSAESPSGSGLRIFPNPVAASTTIEFNGDLGEKIVVFNIQGSKVAEIEVPAGQSSFSWSPGTLASGLYVARYVLDGREESQKLIIK